MLTKEAIKQFKDLYFRHYKAELSDAEASLRANNLISLYEAVYGDLLTGKDQGKKHEITGKKI
ncbi:MAG: hypothetical protein AABX72_03130 [Nanoarchaeota archaeon]